MKKFTIVAMLALGTLALSQQPAPAWTNWKFGIGMNVAKQSGGNCLLWGVYRNGQPPGPDYGSVYPGGPTFYPQDFVPFPAHVQGPAFEMNPATQPAMANNQAYYYNQPNFQTVTFPNYYPNYYYPAAYYYYGR